MNRRTFITLLGGTAAAWPLAALAQPTQKQQRIAFVHSGIRADQLTMTAGPFWVRRFYEKLRELGHIEGGNLVIERYSAEGRSENFASLAATVVSRNPDVIVSNLNGLVKAFKVTTSKIPIVAITGDPIAGGLLTSLSHPGGNLTGVSIDAGIEIVAKRLEILKEAMPKTAKVVYLSSNEWVDSTGSLYREAGQRLGIALTGKYLSEVDDAQLRRTFDEIAQEQFDAALIDESGSFLAQRALIVDLAKQHRLPVLYPYWDYIDLGGLMTYAPDLGELAERLANEVHQILNGSNAGDIPYYQPTKFQLIINVKPAKALGLEIPPSLLLRADEVIE